MAINGESPFAVEPVVFKPVGLLEDGFAVVVDVEGGVGVPDAEADPSGAVVSGAIVLVGVTEREAGGRVNVGRALVAVGLAVDKLFCVEDGVDGVVQATTVIITAIMAMVNKILSK